MTHQSTPLHVFFSGIGGSGIGPLAIMAQQAGYTVSGSDKQESSYTQNLRKQGINLYIGQSEEHIAALHAEHPIGWLVYSSAVPKENPNHPELRFAETHGLKHSRRDEFLNQLLTDHNLKLIAFAGTHGKSTTTAMAIWLLTQLEVPISYSVGAKIPFGPMGILKQDSEYFVYECDEFDRNFLAFHPYLSTITGLSWDHHEIFPTREDYNQAFRDFIGQSQKILGFSHDLESLGELANTTTLDRNDPHIAQITLVGQFNREDAWLAVQTVARIVDTPLDKLIAITNTFPGLKQRMEKLAPSLYTNYAHTPEKIRGGMSAALEIASANNQNLVIVYEPLTNRRQHYIAEDYGDCFAGASKLYWVPSYLAREDPSLAILTPTELITHLADPTIAEPVALDNVLLSKIREHLAQGDLVVAMGASGAGSMDEWLRQAFKPETH